MLEKHAAVWLDYCLPSGNDLHSYGKSQFVMGQLTISMAMFNSYVELPVVFFRGADLDEQKKQL